MRRSLWAVLVGGVVAVLTVGVPSPASADEGCVFSQDGDVVTLTWEDTGGRHVVRRNGRWLATPGAGTSTFIDSNAPVGAVYVVRTRMSGQSIDRTCASDAAERQFVVHVSMDGLRSDHVTPELMPRLSTLVDGGASTMNARTDPAITKTLPNHTSQFTGRFVWGSSGHRVTENNDLGGTVHHSAGEYVASVFDVVHDNEGRTVMYIGKSKFDLLERSWNEVFGAPDITGEDNGRDKIDVFEKEDPTVASAPFVADLLAGSGPTYGFFHIRSPDSAGHRNTWASEGYQEGVREADAILGEVLDHLAEAGIAGSTTIIVTADHGGPDGEDAHDNARAPSNYTVPFVVFGPEVADGADLYELNTGVRTDPGTRRIFKSGPQPIRGHDVANLSLDLLGLPAIPGSLVNVDQSLRVR